jgi:hypothetical protein
MPRGPGLVGACSHACKVVGVEDLGKFDHERCGKTGNDVTITRHSSAQGTYASGATPYSASARVPRLYGPEQVCWARPLALGGHIVSLSEPEIATPRGWFVCISSYPLACYVSDFMAQLRKIWTGGPRAAAVGPTRAPTRAGPGRHPRSPDRAGLGAELPSKCQQEVNDRGVHS